MSYPDDIRGALAATSGASRRVQALKELGLPKEDEDYIIATMDQAADLIHSVAERLKVHGLLGYMNGLGAVMGKESKQQRQERLMKAAERPWKSVKEQVKDLEKLRKESVERGVKNAPQPEPEQTTDIGHFWRES